MIPLSRTYLQEIHLSCDPSLTITFMGRKPYLLVIIDQLDNSFMKLLATFALDTASLSTKSSSTLVETPNDASIAGSLARSVHTSQSSA